MQELDWLWDRWINQGADLIAPFRVAELKAAAKVAADPAVLTAAEAPLPSLGHQDADPIAPLQAVELAAPANAACPAAEMSH